jgi:hypothetical protein
MATTTKQKPQMSAVEEAQTFQVPTVVFAREMFDALHRFPDVLDRARRVNGALVPTNVIAQISRARELLSEYRDLLTDADQMVPVNEELWECVKDWPPLLERCRTYPGTPQLPLRFSGLEIDGIVKTRTLWPEVGE